MIITLSFSPFSVAYSNQRFSNCNSTVDVGFLSSCRTAFVEIGSLRWVSSSAVTFAAEILYLVGTTLCNVQRSLSLSSSFRPLFFSADGVLPLSMCVVITLGTAALVTPNEVAVWLQMLQLKALQQSVLFENLNSLPFGSTFTRSVPKHFV